MKINKILLLSFALIFILYSKSVKADGVYTCGNSTCICVDPGIPDVHGCIQPVEKNLAGKASDKFAAIEYAMLSVMKENGMNHIDSTSNAVRMISVGSGYTQASSVNYSAAAGGYVPNNYYNAKMSAYRSCISTSGQAKNNMNIILTGKSLSKKKIPTTETSGSDACEAMKKGLKQGADFRLGAIKPASILMQRYAVNTVGKHINVFVKVTLRNFKNNSLFKISDLNSKYSSRIEILGYTNKPSINVDDYAKNDFKLNQNLFDSLIKNENNEEYVYYFAFRIDTTEDTQKAGKCYTNLKISYTYDDDTILKGYLYKCKNTSNAQLYITPSFSLGDSIDSDSVNINKLMSCEKCDPNSIGLDNVCRDGLTPDENGNVKYTYEEGHNTIQRCIIDNVDLANNLYRRNDDEANSSYCSVSCKEKYTFTMPYNRYVNNGRYFQLGVGIDGQLDCYSSPVDYDKFHEDIIFDQQRVIEAYNDYVKVNGGGTGFIYEVNPNVTGLDGGVSIVGEFPLSGINATKKQKRQAKQAVKDAATILNNHINEFNKCGQFDVKTYYESHYNPSIEYSYDEPYGSSTKWVSTANKNYQMVVNSKSFSSENAVYCKDNPNNWGTFECDNSKKASKFVKNNHKSYITCSPDANRCRAVSKDMSSIVYAHKWTTVAASYTTPRVFFITDAGKVNIHKGNPAKNEDIIDGLPVSAKTPTGTYYYSISVNNLGIYFNNKGSLGRIYNNKSDDADNSVGIKIFKWNATKRDTYGYEKITTITEGKRTLKTAKNKYACTYKVNVKLCKGHTSSECRNNETEEMCIKRVCPPDTGGSSKYCIKEGSHYYVCNRVRYYSKSACEKKNSRIEALKGAGCNVNGAGKIIGKCKANESCCPECNMICTPPCAIEVKCTGPNCPIICGNNEDCGKDFSPKLNLNFKTVSLANINPNDRTMGYNWDSKNPSNELAAIKASKTIEAIQSSVPQNVSGTAPAPVVKGDEFKITLTPAIIEDIKKWNRSKANKGSYSDESLTCADVNLNNIQQLGLTITKNKNNCENAGYDWINKSCVVQNAVCSSDFITYLAQKSYISPRPSIDKAFTVIGQEQLINSATGSKYRIISNNTTSTLMIFDSLEISRDNPKTAANESGDRIPDIGPAWR